MSENKKIEKAKELLTLALPYVVPNTDPFETDEGYKVYRIQEEIKKFISNE